jgi:hypothetical protein
MVLNQRKSQVREQVQKCNLNYNKSLRRRKRRKTYQASTLLRPPGYYWSMGERRHSENLSLVGPRAPQFFCAFKPDFYWWERWHEPQVQPYDPCRQITVRPSPQEIWHRNILLWSAQQSGLWIRKQEHYPVIAYRVTKPKYAFRTIQATLSFNCLLQPGAYKTVVNDI